MMESEQIRADIMHALEMILARPFMIWGRERTILMALRSFVATASAGELSRIEPYLTAEEPK